MINRLFGNRSDMQSMSEKSDNELVNSAINGSKECWKELVKRYYRMMFSTVYRITGGRDTDDVMQEVLIQLFKSLGSFRRESAFSTFLYRLTLNTACSEVKKMTSLSSIVAVGNDVVDRMIDNDFDADSSFERLEKEEMEKQIQKALLKIEPDSRMYLTLFYVEELTLKEISEMVGSPLTTVASRIKKGKIMLLKEMEKFK